MSKTVEVRRVARMNSLLVTANEDGSIPLNSQVLASIGEATDDVWNLIVDGVNTLLDYEHTAR